MTALMKGDERGCAMGVQGNFTVEYKEGCQHIYGKYTTVEYTLRCGILVAFIRIFILFSDLFDLYLGDLHLVPPSQSRA